MASQEIQDASVPELLFQKSYKSIRHIRDRTPVRYEPLNKTEYSNAGEQISITLTHDQLDDLSSSALSMDVELGGADVSYNSAVDLFSEVQVYFNDEPLERYRWSGLWSQAFTAYSANDSWVMSEGQALLGYNNQLTNLGGAYVDRTQVSPQNRSVSIPLALLFGICRIPNFMPILGGKLRFVFTVASPAEALSRYENPATADSTFTLKNVSLVSDMITVSDNYRNALKGALMSDIGLKIPYTAFDVAQFPCVRSNIQRIRKEYNFSNCLSLFMLRRVENKDDHTEQRNPNMIAPLPNFTELRVRSGSRQLTPPSGIRNYAELYRSTELATTSLADLSGTGVVGYKHFTEDIAKKDEYASTGAQYGYCLIGLNLEKTCSPDDESPMDSGMSASAQGASTEFIIELERSQAFDATDTIDVNLVHRNVLVMKQGGLRVVV